MQFIYVTILVLLSLHTSVSSSSSDDGFRTRTLIEVSEIKNLCSDMILFFRDIRDEKCWNIELMSLYPNLKCVTEQSIAYIDHVVKKILKYRVYPICPDFTKCPSRLHLSTGCQQIIAAKAFRQPSWRPSYLFFNTSKTFESTSNSSEVRKHDYPWFPFIICNTIDATDNICFDHCFIDDSRRNLQIIAIETLIGCTDKHSEIQENKSKSDKVVFCNSDYCNQFYKVNKKSRVKYLCENENKVDRCIMCRIVVYVNSNENLNTHSSVDIRYDCLQIGFPYRQQCTLHTRKSSLKYIFCCQGNYCNLRHRKMCFACKKKCILDDNIKIEERKYDHYQCYIENIGGTLIYGITEKCFKNQTCCHGNLCNKKTIVCSSCDNQTVSECGVGSLCMSNYMRNKISKCGCSRTVKESPSMRNNCLFRRNYCCNTDHCKLQKSHLAKKHYCFTNSGKVSCPGLLCLHDIRNMITPYKGCVNNINNSCPIYNSVTKMCCLGELCNSHKILKCYDCPNGEMNCSKVTYCIAGISHCMYSYKSNGSRSMSCKYNCTSKSNEYGIDICCKDDLCNKYREHCWRCTNLDPSSMTCKDKDISTIMCQPGKLCYKLLQGNDTSSYYSQLGCLSRDMCDSIEDENGKIIKRDSSAKSLFNSRCCLGNKCNTPILKLCYKCDDSSIDRMLRCSEGGYLIKGHCHSHQYCSITKKRYSMILDWYYTFGCTTYESTSDTEYNTTTEHSVSTWYNTNNSTTLRRLIIKDQIFNVQMNTLLVCEGSLCNSVDYSNNVTCYGNNQDVKQCHDMDKCGFEEKDGISTYGCFQRLQCHKHTVTCCMGNLCNRKLDNFRNMEVNIWSMYSLYILLFTVVSYLYIYREYCADVMLWKKTFTRRSSKMDSIIKSNYTAYLSSNEYNETYERTDSKYSHV